MPKLKVCWEDITPIVRDGFFQEGRHLHLWHQLPSRLSEWQQQRAQLLLAIRQRAGSFPPAPDLAVQVHGRHSYSGYKIKNITYQSRPGMRVTANLYVPEGKGPFPAVLGVHGHWYEGKAAEKVQARGHVLAKSGFVVLNVDAFGAGERGTFPGKFEYHGGPLGGQLFNLGETLLGMQVYDNMRGVDLLTTLDYVDAERIGVTGASGGGNQTMWLAALDERIKAAVPVVSVGTFESYITRTNCVCEVLPDGLTFMEEWMALALAAPNALLLLNALRDSNPTFAVSEMLRSFSYAREIYRLYDREDHIAYQAFDLPHGYWPEMLEAMLGWFKRWLKNEGEGRPCRLPEYSPLPIKDCLCFPDGKRPPEVCSIREYYHRQSTALCADHLNNSSPIKRKQKTAALRAVLRMASDDHAPAKIVPVGIEQCEKYKLNRELFFFAQHCPIPLVTATVGNRQPETMRLIIHPEGKQHFEDNKALFDQIDAKHALAFADLRGSGETRYDQSSIAPFHDHLRALFWLGRTLLGEWASDILHLATILKQRAHTVDITAFGETGLAALAASACGAPIRHIQAVGMMATYVSDAGKISPSMAVHVPGILQWGDVSMLAAAATAEVEIINPVTPQGELCDAAQCAKLAQEIQQLTKRWDHAGPGVQVKSDPTFKP